MEVVAVIDGVGVLDGVTVPVQDGDLERVVVVDGLVDFVGVLDGVNVDVAEWVPKAKQIDSENR